MRFGASEVVHHIIIPHLGATGSDVQIVKWLAREGDFVPAGTPLLTVETDKATEDIPAFHDGYLRQILAPVGAELAIGEIVALLTDEADEPFDERNELTQPTIAARIHSKGSSPAEIVRANTPDVAAPNSSTISPRARQLAIEHGIDLGSVKTSRSDGVIRTSDVMAVVRARHDTAASAGEIVSRDFLIGAFRRMVLIRRYEEHLYHLFLQGLVPGTLHQCQGQEAVAVGVCSALRVDDVIFSTHRPVGHLIAKGASLNALTAEIWGKATGCVGGKGGQMHLADFSVGAMVSNAIVGANIPIATGAALAFRLQGVDRVTVSFFGDGASNIGAFHEGINLAAVQNAPVVFVCENNLYAASTHISAAMRITDIADRAPSYGIPGFAIDGMDLIAVYQSAREAVERARAGHGPTLLEYKTYRYRGHSRGDPCGYRNKQEFHEWSQRDPIELLRALLLTDFAISPESLVEIENQCQADVEAAVEFAIRSPEPADSECTEHVFTK